jgi:error-prone DNA polymerase
MIPMTFVHLHVHSYFSFEQGTADPARLLRRCREFGMSAVAVTDYDGLYGAVRLLKHAKEIGIKPIIGMEITLQDGHQLILLAKNTDGYSNLCRLTSAMHLSSRNRFPICSIDVLRKYSANLIALSAGAGGEIGALLSQEMKKEAEAALGKYLDLFEIDNFYLELQDHFLPHERILNGKMLELAGEFGVGVVATNNVHFLRPEEHGLHEALVRASRVVHHTDRPAKPNREFYLKSPEEMRALFPDIPEAIENTLAIAEACNVKLELDKIRAPAFVTSKGTDAGEMLEEICRRALPAIYGDKMEEAEIQLRHELEVIRDKGFSDYFLMVRDIAVFARTRGIRCSCRGSASSSIVTYLLGISGVDPLANHLLFERFLNPERRDIPDIDLDFDSRRREEVLDYILHKYGTGMACMVATVPTFAARSALRELARANGMDYGMIERLTAYLPYVPASRLRRAMEILPEMRSSPLRDRRYTRLVEFAEDLGGFPHFLSVHLGGVVVWDRLADIVPMQRSPKGYPVAQFDKDDLETLGLIKTDILSLRMLGAMGEAEERIRAGNPFFNIESMPRNDPEVYELLRSTRTVGCFQVESPGMRQLLGRLQPERFSDIVATISLFRPGPVKADMVTPFLARRWGREEVDYPHPRLEPILKETYGEIVFQEQVLRTTREIAGFSLGQADLMRRAITEEVTAEELATLRRQFVEGAKRNGIEAGPALRIFHKLAAFASFGFPKAHAVSFAKISYESAWLKRHHPVEFFLGLLNNEPGLYPIGVIANEACRCGVAIQGVNINESNARFAIKNGEILAGLNLVKGIGTVYLEKISRERVKRPFTDVSNFRTRIGLPGKLVDSLILCGAFDSLEPNRRKLLLVARSEGVEGDIEDFSPAEKARFEIVLTGLTFSGHPISFLRPELSKRGVISSRQLEKCMDGERISVAGLKVVLHTPPTRSGRRVVFLTLEDEDGLSDITVFSEAQQKFAKTIFGRYALIVEGRLQKFYPRSFAIVAEKVTPLSLK